MKAWHGIACTSTDSGLTRSPCISINTHRGSGRRSIDRPAASTAPQQQPGPSPTSHITLPTPTSKEHNGADAGAQHQHQRGGGGGGGPGAGRPDGPTARGRRCLWRGPTVDRGAPDAAGRGYADGEPGAYVYVCVHRRFIHSFIHADPIKTQHIRFSAGQGPGREEGAAGGAARERHAALRYASFVCGWTYAQATSLAQRPPNNNNTLQPRRRCAWARRTASTSPST